MIFARRTSIFLTLLTLLPPLAFSASRSNPTRPAQADAAYKAAVIVDVATGNVLFEDNADLVSPPASMTKLMTFAVVHDKLLRGELTLSTPIKVAPEDARMGGTQVFLDPRETFAVEELIYAMMVQSANDAAHALARAAGGSVPAFVALMNAKAAELGMTNTTFRTPHGLPPPNRKAANGDLTTARDFARLSRHLLLATDAVKYTSVRERAFGIPPRAEPIAMKNHNNLLGKIGGVDGLKTGFTNGAGFCIAASAQRDGRRVIVVTMGSPSAKTRDLKVAELLEQGFAALPLAPVAPPVAGSPIIPAPNPLGAEKPAPSPAREPQKAPPSDPTIKFAIPKR